MYLKMHATLFLSFFALTPHPSIATSMLCSDYGGMKGTRSEHKARERRSPHRQRLSRQYHAASRIYRIILGVSLVLYLGHTLLYNVHKVYDKHLRDQPTDFTPLIGSKTVVRVPQSPVLYDNGTHISEQYVFMRYLGQGKEGKAAVYVDTARGKLVVVKTYFGRGQNTLPRELQDLLDRYASQWPNEIEASLLLSDLRPNDRGVFVPVVDFFLLQTQDQSRQWALVTPFIEGGTLFDLAGRIRVKGGKTTWELDQEFRPVLHSALDALERLHDRGYCHDDIKADNLFVLDTHRWLLGDLGQVRQSSHPWHKTRTWKERNQWSNCQLNDVRRLLKSYLTFLREASADRLAFDQAFSQGSEAWSTLYWSWMDKSMSAEETIELSRGIGPGTEVKSASEQHMHNVGACLQWSVERELRCTSILLHWHEYLSHWHCRKYPR